MRSMEREAEFVDIAAMPTLPRRTSIVLVAMLRQQNASKPASFELPVLLTMTLATVLPVSSRILGLPEPGPYPMLTVVAESARNVGR
jgi:hypothetical protein